MKPPPSSLPAANSRKWHSRRWWDSLGYFRVRSLANPDWERDVDRVVRFLGNERPARPGRAQEAIDEAVLLARRYDRLRQRAAETPEAFAGRRDDEWDLMLAAIDEVLEIRQRDHLRDVDDAGASGPRAD